MSDLIGYSEYVEYAGIYTDKEILFKTGIYNKKSGDYLDYILIDYYTAEIVNYDEIKFNGKLQKNIDALREAINRLKWERKKPKESFYNGKEVVCPYCKKALYDDELYVDKENHLRICRCGKIYKEGLLWQKKNYLGTLLQRVY